jgi:ferredoxin
MPLWFIRGLRRGVVTTRYPAHPDESARYLPSPPAFRPRALTGKAADLLVSVCPSGALLHAADKGVLRYDVGRCTACGRCAAAAPHAVTSSGAWELAATARPILIKTIPLRGRS